MNHPTSEQWISYCYRELGIAERAELKAHLQTCHQCARHLQDWRSAQRDLNAWVVKPRRTPRAPTLPVLKWAAIGAAMLLCFALGGFAMSPYVRAELAQATRAETHKALDAMAAASEQRTRGLLRAFAKEIHSQHQKEIRDLYSALDKIDSQRAADCVVLKRELDTLAINADAELKTAERDLVQLATFTQTAAASPQE
jgi:hypothetical protein